MLSNVLRRIGVVTLVAVIIGSLWFMAAVKADPMIIGPSFIPRTLMELQVNRSDLPGVPSLRLSSVEVDPLKSTG